METTIDGRRYWKVDNQWYRELRAGDEKEDGYHFRWNGSDQWVEGFDKYVGDIVCGDEKKTYRAPCDEPAVSKVVKEGDMVMTPMGPGKVVQPVSGTFTTVIKPEPRQAVVTDVNGDVDNDIIRSIRVPAIVLDRPNGPPLEFFVDEFQAVQSYGSCSTVRLRGRGDIPVAVNGNEVLKRVREAGNILGIAQAERAKSRGAVAVALEDSQPDGDYHKVRVRLIDGSYRVFDASQFKDVRSVGSDSCQVRLTDGTTLSVAHALDIVLEDVRAALAVTSADPVAKTSTVTLRDQFALAALPAITEKYVRECRNVVDRGDLVMEVWELADAMMYSRNKSC